MKKDQKTLGNIRKHIITVLVLVSLTLMASSCLEGFAYGAEASGVVKNDGVWVYVKDGKVDTSFNGLAKNSNGWWKITAGKVDFKFTGLVKNDKGWWYVKKGKIDFNHTGLVKNDKGWWYVKKGKIDFNYTGLVKNDKGWWYVKKGKIDFNHTGLVKNDKGWWYVKKGKIDFNYTGLVKNDKGWWYVKKGKIDFSYTGLATNSKGTWYVKNGKIDFSERDGITSDGDQWNILNGRAEKVENSKDSALYKALQRVKEVTSDSMTKEEKLKACFDYIKTTPEKNPWIPHTKSMDWPEKYANHMFDNGYGNCFGYAACFAYMAKAIGYEEVYACHDTGHGFVEIDGMVYDPEWSKSHFYSTFFGISYDTPTDEMQNYPLVLEGSKSAPWMRIKI